MGQVRYRSITALVLLASTVSAPVCWANLELGPSWSENPYAPNSSFLMTRDEAPAYSSMLDRDRLFPKKMSADMQLKYADMNRDYEMRKNHYLVSAYEERAHNDQMSDFTMSVLKDVQANQARLAADNAKQAVDRDPSLSILAKPVGIAAAAAMFYYGKPLSVRVAHDSKVTARSEIPKQRGSLFFDSPIINSSVEFMNNPNANRNPLDPPPVDPTQQDEKYRFSIARGVPFLDVTSRLSYGTTTSTMSASLSKNLTQNITAIVDSSKPIHPDQSATKNGQQTVKLLYGIHF